MLTTKAFEIRDKMTFIPVMAAKLAKEPTMGNWYIEEEYLIRRAGYAKDTDYIVVTILTSLESNCDIFKWENRTMRNAHQHILENFDSLKGGEVIDIEYILGETKAPKLSERVEKDARQREIGHTH